MHNHLTPHPGGTNCAAPRRATLTPCLAYQAAQKTTGTLGRRTTPWGENRGPWGRRWPHQA